MTSTLIETYAPPLGPRDAGIPLTLDEFEEADYEEGWRYELIHGVLIVSPPPLEEERDANEELGRWLRNHQADHPQGSAIDLTLPEQNVHTGSHFRRPDRVIWAGLGRRPKSRGPIEGRDVPTIVIEFASVRPSDQRRDYEEKRIEYRDIGVREYWIVDRFRRTMTVHRWRDEKWVDAMLAEDVVYTTPLLPGFELSLARLFDVSDQYEDD